MKETKLRKAQLAETELLRAFVSICEAEGLQYYFLGGTLLGAVRHKGFIPWDDDIDVGMPRKDYNRFITVAGKYLDDDIKIIHYKIDPSTPYYFIKLINTRVSFSIQGSRTAQKLNCWIDVFPIDGVPNNVLIRWWHMRVLDYYKMLLSFSRIKNLPKKENRPAWKSLLYFSAYHLSADKFVDPVEVKRAMDRELEKYPIDCCAIAGNYVGVYREKEFVPREYFGQGSKVEFEGQIYDGPAETDKYLRHIYGDYMQLPPEEKQTSDHHVIEIEFVK